MTGIKLVKAKKKQQRFNKNATFVRAISEEVHHPQFKRGIFIFETKEGDVQTIFRNCYYKDTLHLFRRAEHMMLAAATGEVMEVPVGGIDD